MYGLWAVRRGHLHNWKARAKLQAIRGYMVCVICDLVTPQLMYTQQADDRGDFQVVTATGTKTHRIRPRYLPGIQANALLCAV